MVEGKLRHWRLAGQTCFIEPSLVPKCDLDREEHQMSRQTMFNILYRAVVYSADTTTNTGVCVYVMVCMLGNIVAFYQRTRLHQSQNIHSMRILGINENIQKRP